LMTLSPPSDTGAQRGALNDTEAQA
jgi:hypothetical protein